MRADQKDSGLTLFPPDGVSTLNITPESLKLPEFDFKFLKTYRFGY
jgi:hypothetical protein